MKIKLMDIKKIILIVFLSIVSKNSYSQSEILKLPIKDLNGKILSINDMKLTSDFYILAFWAMWCKPCLEEMDALNESLDYIKGELNTSLIGISLDDSRNVPKLKSFINSRGWEFEVLNDYNTESKKVLNYDNIPYLVVTDKSGKIIYSSNNYYSGKEEDIFKAIKKGKK